MLKMTLFNLIIQYISFKTTVIAVFEITCASGSCETQISCNQTEKETNIGYEIKPNVDLIFKLVNLVIFS